MQHTACTAAMLVAAMLVADLGIPAPAAAKEAGSHVCPPRNPPAQPAPPHGQTVTKPADGSELVMGCLERAYPLTRLSLKGAKRAVAIAEEPNSVAALFAYKTSAERDTLIGDWIRRWMAEGVTLPQPMTFFITGHASSAWRLPDGSRVHALHPEKSEAGALCIVRADVNALRAALPVLNNWCMDRLGLWRKD